jgi:hypothetical protein
MGPSMADAAAPASEQRTLAEQRADAGAVAEHEVTLARLTLERLTLEREIAKLSQPMAAEEAAAARKSALARLKLDRAKDEHETAKLTHAASPEEAATALARSRLEHAELERAITRLSRPWWRSGNVALFAVLLALVAPATAGVMGYFERSTQLALEEQRHRHDGGAREPPQTPRDVDRGVDRTASPEPLRRSLRLLMETSSDEKARQWAREELQRVEQRGF